VFIEYEFDNSDIQTSKSIVCQEMAGDGVLIGWVYIYTLCMCTTPRAGGAKLRGIASVTWWTRPGLWWVNCQVRHVDDKGWVDHQRAQASSNRSPRGGQAVVRMDSNMIRMDSDSDATFYHILIRIQIGYGSCRIYTNTNIIGYEYKKID
jgi:hypothetical protein